MRCLGGGGGNRTQCPTPRIYYIYTADGVFLHTEISTWFTKCVTADLALSTVADRLRSVSAAGNIIERPVASARFPHWLRNLSGPTTRIAEQVTICGREGPQHYDKLRVIMHLTVYAINDILSA